MTELVLMFLFGTLIVARNLEKSVQIIIGLVLIVLAVLGYGVSHFLT